MPQATQILDSVHVVAAFHKDDRPCEVRGEARAGEEAQGSSRLKKRRASQSASLRRERSSTLRRHISGRRVPARRQSDAGRLWLPRQKIYNQSLRPALLVDDALCRS